MYDLTIHIAFQIKSLVEGALVLAQGRDNPLQTGLAMTAVGRMEQSEIQEPSIQVIPVIQQRPLFPPELRQSIQEFVKTRLGSHEYPREISFVESFPMTTSGKILRRELRK